MGRHSEILKIVVVGEDACSAACSRNTKPSYVIYFERGFVEDSQEYSVQQTDTKLTTD
jgi:hypothetical protein